jgi:hypothetical protein
LNWRLKALTFQVLDKSPGGEWMYRFAQKHITRNHLFEVTDAYLRLHRFHIEQYRRVHPGRAMEFGAGRHFISPLLLSNAGASEVLVFDIQPLTSPLQINHTIRQLRGRVPGDWPEIRDWNDLQSRYRIRYLAPGDARATGLADGSVQFFCSTSTLEHIPAPDIRSILAECTRVAASGAMVSHVVDYADHYRYSDPSLPLFNFYRYSDARWRLFNPSNHHQNRLRHGDYVRMFADAGLQAVEIRSGSVDAGEIAGIDLDARFRGCSTEDLLTSIGYFALRKP